MQRGFSVIFILFGLLMLVVLVGGGYFLYKSNNCPGVKVNGECQGLGVSPKFSQKACTLEAKLCPDGSAVGRTGPNCEFAQCPKSKESTNSADTADWKTYTNTTHSFLIKYPPNLEVKSFIEGVAPEVASLVTIGFPKSPIIVISGVLKREDESLSDFQNRNLLKFGNPKVSKKDIIIDSYPAILLEASVGGDKKGSQYFVYIEQDKFHIISLYSSTIYSGENEDKKVLFDQMLDTFKFLE